MPAAKPKTRAYYLAIVREALAIGDHEAASRAMVAASLAPRVAS